jgi:hypothetical protein
LAIVAASDAAAASISSFFIGVLLTPHQRGSKKNGFSGDGFRAAGHRAGSNKFPNPELATGAARSDRN